jgi:hypothetical protein
MFFCFIKDDGGKNSTSWQTQKKGLIIIVDPKGIR